MTKPSRPEHPLDKFTPATLREPLASAMSVAEMEALVAALRGEGSRLERALAFGRRLVRQLEVAEHPTALPSEVHLAIEAIERAWAHFRPAKWDPNEARSIDFAYVETVIRELTWAREEVERRVAAILANREESTLTDSERSALREARDTSDVIGALVAMQP